MIMMVFRYKSVLGLVKDSVGAAQTLDTSCSRSPGVLLLLSPGVVRFLLFAGCADENKEVRSSELETSWRNKLNIF